MEDGGFTNENNAYMASYAMGNGVCPSLLNGHQEPGAAAGTAPKLDGEIIK
jgi:hypothetical protein